MRHENDLPNMPLSSGAYLIMCKMVEHPKHLDEAVSELYDKAFEWGPDATTRNFCAVMNAISSDLFRIYDFGFELTRIVSDECFEFTGEYIDYHEDAHTIRFFAHIDENHEVTFSTSENSMRDIEIPRIREMMTDETGNFTLKPFGGGWIRVPEQE